MWGWSEVWPTNNRRSFHLSVGGWPLSHSLFTLYNICMTKKVWQILFLMSKQQFSTPARQIFFKLPSNWDAAAVLVCETSRGVVTLVTVWLCVSVFMCACKHARSPFPILIQLSALHTQRGGELSLNATSWSNGTTLDYNCQQWQLEKRTKPGAIPRQIILQFEHKYALSFFSKGTK